MLKQLQIQNYWRKYAFGLLLLPILLAFYMINSYTFFESDDWAMRYTVDNNKTGAANFHYASSNKVDTLGEAFSKASYMYKHWGGGFIAYVEQSVFCGIIDNKLWFDIINTIVFLTFICIGTCIIKKNNSSKSTTSIALLFSFLFWFFAPVPNQTLYWVVGRYYLWSSLWLLVYLLLYLKFADKNSDIFTKVVLFVVALLFGHMGVIGSISVCGALVTWFIFNIREFKGNVVPLSLGCGIGTLTNILAPGNFERLQVDPVGTSPITMMAIIKTFFSYKILYLLLIAVVLMWIFRREELNMFYKKNVILILALFWSIVAFSIVFRPSTRACITTEVLSLLLLVSICNDYLNKKWKIGIIAGLFILFLWDAKTAIKEAKEQYYRNQEIHDQIRNSDGTVCFDKIPHEHRMVLPIRFESWAYPGMITEYGLDSLYIQPLAYCEISPENDQCTTSNHRPDIHEFGYICKSSIILKLSHEQYQSCGLTCLIEYCKRKKISRELRKKIGLYKYEHYMTIHLSKPDFVMNGYDYYIIPPVTNNYGDYISKVEIVD